MPDNPSSPLPFDDHDAESLALCAWKEARGDGPYAMQAVMRVIINRSQAKGFPRSLHDVIYGKNQFTSMSVPSDPEFNLQPDINDAMWQGAVLISQQVLSGILPDVTRGACWYANLAHIDKGGWFARNILEHPVNHPITVVIGKQTFFA